jgi:hypothetical protein
MKTFSKTLVGIGALIAFGTHSLGAEAPTYDPADTRCKSFDDSALQKFAGILDFASTVLPNVPPEESKYLQAETDAAYKLQPTNEAQSNARYAGLEKRPLYQVWVVRRSLTAAQDSIAAITNNDSSASAIYKKSPEAEKLNRALRAETYAVNYSRAMTRFLTLQERSPNGVMLTADQYSGLWGGVYSLPEDIGYYMDCKLAKVMGRQALW